MKEHPNYKYRPRRKPKSLVSKMDSPAGGGGGYGPPGSPGMGGLPGLGGLGGLPRLLAPSPCPPPPRHADLPPHGAHGLQGLQGLPGLQGLQGLPQGFSPSALLSRVGALFPPCPLPYPLYPLHAAQHKLAQHEEASSKIADMAWQALYSSSLYSQAAASLSWPPLPVGGVGLPPPPSPHGSPCGLHCGCGPGSPSPPSRRSPRSHSPRSPRSRSPRSPSPAPAPLPPDRLASLADRLAHGLAERLDVKRPIPFLAARPRLGGDPGAEPGLPGLPALPGADGGHGLDDLARMRSPARPPPFSPTPQHVI